MIIGLDIGASWVKGVVWGKNMLVAGKMRTPQNLASFKTALPEFISELSANKKIKSMGVGVAGLVSDKKSIWCPNIPYLNNFALADFLAKKTGLKVMLDNDARCFLRSELTLGAAKGYKNVLGLTVGSGLGGALAINGKIVSGAHNTAGEIGHMIMNNNELESLASAKFIKRHPRRYEDLGKNLGVGIVNAVYILDPELIIIGGGFMKNKADAKRIMLALTKQIKSLLRAKPAGAVKIKTTALGEFAGAIGAALLVE